MQGWRVKKFGGLDAMHWDEMDDPKVGANQVLVSVSASGVNFAETRMRAGTYTGLKPPVVLGLEGAGVVEKIGSNVSNCTEGDKIFFRGRGSHATKCLINSHHAFKLPQDWTFEQGAAAGVGWLTAWHALHVIANVQPGSNVLIEAVASSVGTAALQIAKSKGCKVIGTASQDEKLLKAKNWGADEIINYKTEDVYEKVMEFTNGKGLDTGCMTIGEETSSALIRSMGNGGKVIMYGSTGGRKVTFDLGIGSRNIQLISMSIDTSPFYISETLKSFREIVIPSFNNGTFMPVIDTVLSISDLAKAHNMVGDREHFGKIILSIE